MNVSSKTVAIFAAALTLLDSAVIPLVSAATAANYLTGELPSGTSSIPFPQYLLVAMIIVFFLILSMAGIRDSSRIAFAILCFHVSATFCYLYDKKTDRTKDANYGHVSHCWCYRVDTARQLDASFELVDSARSIFRIKGLPTLQRSLYLVLGPDWLRV